MNKLVMFICLLWVYDLIVCVFATVFLNHVREDAYVLCDVMTLPHVYLGIFVFIHVIICIIVCTSLIFVIKKTVNDHQCKIQVSNTITYNNLIEDSQVAMLFYLVTMVTFVCWLPFMICEILLMEEIQTTEMLNVGRWTFLFGQLGYLKWFWFLTFSKPLQHDFKGTFIKTNKSPFRMGPIVREL